MKDGATYFIKIFNTLMYLTEFKHKLTKAPINISFTKTPVAPTQQTKKSRQTNEMSSQVEPSRTESKDEGLGVLPDKDAI
jgi:hypothetical protein